jgi:hypothetical protein
VPSSEPRKHGGVSSNGANGGAGEGEGFGIAVDRSGAGSPQVPESWPPGMVVEQAPAFTPAEINAYGMEVARALHALAIRMGFPPLHVATQMATTAKTLPPEYANMPSIRLVDQNQAFLATPALAAALGVPPLVAGPRTASAARCRMAGCRNADNPYHECSRFCAAAIKCPNRANPFHWCTVWCQHWLPVPVVPSRIKKPTLAKPRQNARGGRAHGGGGSNHDLRRASARAASRRTYTEDEYEWLDRMDDDEEAAAPPNKARLIVTQTKLQKGIFAAL